MLRIYPRYSAQDTKDYYKQALSTSDYYSEKGEIIGQWRGQTAEKIGLSDKVNEQQFNHLCDNINPVTEEKLTPRTNENRRVAYDFTFSVPKSISLAYAINDDPQILEAFQSSYLETMNLIEQNAETRVRVGGKKEERVTENLLYSDYIHSTSRPLEDGTPDPHLHVHCVVMNVTYDDKEEKFKAVELGNVRRDAPFYQAYFNSLLADKLSKAGYDIVKTKDAFGLANVSRETEMKFSRRTSEIEKMAADKGILSDKIKDKLGAKTRKRKSKNYSFLELKEIWKNRLTEDEINGLKPQKNTVSFREKMTAKQAIDFSVKHHLERKSAVEEKQLLTYAMQQSVGSVSVKELQDSLKQFGLKSKETKEGIFYTTQQAIEEEKFLIQTTRKGKGSYSPINAKYKIENKQMSKEQKTAVRHALKSKDLVTVIAGGAGTGKTWSVKEIANGARKAGRRFHAFAPSAAASRGVQVAEGFQNATTIAELLQSGRLQQNVKDGIIWIDEAGMVGNKTMGHILNIAKQQNARVLLTGDIKQHNSVQRGDALRIMQQKAGVRVATIKTIRRQKKEIYKQAIKMIASGELTQAFKTLDNFGAIKESEDQQQTLKAASKEYVRARKDNQEVLLVATTHKQGKAVTQSIRDDLKKQQLLAGEAKSFYTNETTSYTEAQKQDATNYEKGQIITFHKSGKGGFVKGRDYKVEQIKDGNIFVSDKNGAKRTLNLKETEKFTVFNQAQTELLKGDLIRMTKNLTSKDSKRLNNGDILSIKGFTKEGDIKAVRGRTNLILGKEQGHFAHGYYTTSPASQGKSVNKVIVVQTKASGRAASKEQFYVSASRGKFEISVHTDDKRTMLNSVQRTSSRMTALEIGEMGFKDKMKEKIDALRRIARTKISKAKDRFYRKNLSSIVRKPIPLTKTAKHVIKGR